MKPRHRRLALVAAGLTLASAGVTLALGAFRSNLVFFVTPTQIAAGQAERGALLRRDPGAGADRAGATRRPPAP